MKTIDLDQLSCVNGGVRDPGDGSGCIPSPFPRPRPEQPIDDLGRPRPPIFGGGGPVPMQ